MVVRFGWSVAIRSGDGYWFEHARFGFGGSGDRVAGPEVVTRSGLPVPVRRQSSKASQCSGVGEGLDAGMAARRLGCVPLGVRAKLRSRSQV